MKKYFKFILPLALIGFVAIGCEKYPLDDDGLLITRETSTAISNFDIKDTDDQTVRIGNSYIDTMEQVVIAYARYGLPLNNLWPTISLTESYDSRVDPPITQRTNFEPSVLNLVYQAGEWTNAGATEVLRDRILALPKDQYPAGAIQYTIVSGNRKVRKTYTVLIAVQPLVDPS